MVTFVNPLQPQNAPSPLLVTLEGIVLLVNPQQLEALSSAVKAKLADNLKARCEFSPSPSVANGFKLAFKDNDVLYDFTDQALADAVASYVGPRIAAALSDKN